MGERNRNMPPAAGAINAFADHIESHPKLYRRGCLSLPLTILGGIVLTRFIKTQKEVGWLDADSGAPEPIYLPINGKNLLIDAMSRYDLTAFDGNLERWRELEDKFMLQDMPIHFSFVLIDADLPESILREINERTLSSRAISAKDNYQSGWFIPIEPPPADYFGWDLPKREGNRADLEKTITANIYAVYETALANHWTNLSQAEIDEDRFQFYRDRAFAGELPTLVALKLPDFMEVGD